MITARNSPSIPRVIFAMLCVLGLCGLGWTQNPPAAKPADNASVLWKEPALQVKLTVKFKRPKVQDIIERLRTVTKLELTLADNIDRTRPVFDGLSFYNAPAWVILDQLAKSTIVQGKWERRGKGYRLTSPLPPFVPADAEPPAPAGPAKLGLRYFLFALPLLAIFGMLLLLRRRRRSQQAVAASQRPKHRERPHPTGATRS